MKFDFHTGEDPREDKAVEDLTFEFFEARRERALAGPRPAATGAEAFRERLRNEARVLTNGNVDVSAFVGSVVDVALLDEAAAELRRRLGPDVTDAATKILTTGVSGQQLALPLARLMSVPLVACRREAAGAGAVANAMGRGAYADALDVTYRSKLCGNQLVSEVITSTPSSRRSYGDNIASMAWGARNVISTQVPSTTARASSSICPATP